MIGTGLDRILKERYRKGWQDDISAVWRLSMPYTGRLIIAILCSIVLSAINGAIAWAVKPALDNIFIKKSSDFLILLTVGVIILFFLRGAFIYLTNYLMNSIGAKIAKVLRQGIYEKLLYLPLSFYGMTHSGSVVSKVLNDVEVLRLTIAHSVKDFLVSGATVVALAIIAIYRRLDLALLSFIVIPLVIYSIWRLGERMRRTSMDTRILISRVTTILHETLHGTKIIKAFTMENEMAERNKKALSEHYRNTMREVRINEFSSLMAEVLGGIGMAIILFYGGYLVISEKLSTGSFFSFLAAILMMYTPLKRLSKVHNGFQQGRSAIQRIREIALITPERKGGVEREIKGHIVFKDVSFKYPFGEDCVLKGINLEVKPGEVVALVGYSGVGKSTLVDLLMGFWYPTEGDIYIDGINTKDLSLQSLRRHIGIVTQDVVLFDETIKANILFGCPDAADAEVVEAAKSAYAHEFIVELPEGYETQIGEKGVRLSGGQKQRIAIARALLRSPSILIMDEATSSLDIDSEQKIQDALEQLIEGRTTIVIAHRVSTIKRASRIIVIEDGRIVEDGTHQELFNKGGIYHQLYNLQYTEER